MATFLTDSADLARACPSSKLHLKQRSELGQFLTPAVVARFMARQFNNLSGHIHLLDPGAGIGTLTAAVVEQLLTNPDRVSSCSMTAYEIEPVFLPSLHQTLVKCCAALNGKGIQANYCLKEENFIKASGEMNSPLLEKTFPDFTHAILNPPYRKIHSQSAERKILSRLGIEAVNLYSAFVWLATLKLAEDGEMVAITPRSFCNGTYFRPFRKAFLEAMKLKKIHIFESRSTTFSEDEVLQENIIFHALKSNCKPMAVKITSNSEIALDEISELRYATYDDVIEPNDSEQFIYIVTDSLKNSVRVQMNKMPCTLAEIGLEVSTGPVVDFRLKSALRSCLDDESVPLLYPESIKGRSVIFPPDRPRKPIAIAKNPDTEKWLLESGWYVLTKRFSAKEEKRRIVAAVCSPLDSGFLGIENHLNYYHAQGRGMSPDLAKGLAAFLNSTLLDSYFRQFSGHTQVNATDLRRIRYPQEKDLIRIGVRIGDDDLSQEEIDEIVHETLPIMTEATTAIHASKRIAEALTILKAVSAPREHQHERTALCLLALADIQPDKLWSQATAPKRGLTDMMNWFRKYYGKHYAPNTHATIQRQTMPQLVQMGLVVENPDQLERPIGSPKRCYQLHQQALSLLQVYGSEQWAEACGNYLVSVTNELPVRD